MENENLKAENIEKEKMLTKIQQQNSILNEKTVSFQEKITVKN